MRTISIQIVGLVVLCLLAGASADYTVEHPDATTTTHASILEAVNASIAGDTIVLPEGITTITSSLRTNASITGTNAIIQGAGGIDCIVITGTHVTIDSIGLEGCGQGIVIERGSHDTTIESVSIRDTSLGIFIENTTYRWSIINSSFIDLGSTINIITDEIDTQTTPSGDGRIYWNEFIDCVFEEPDLARNVTYAMDGRGNYWSSYDGQDDGSNNGTEGDGIGDTLLPYHGIDPYPEFRDEDNDLVNDGVDAFPEDSTQWNDTDLDGYGDNPNGNSPDAFPEDPREHLDSDNDGVGDISDRLPFDHDDDGYNDSLEASLGTDPTKTSTYIGEPHVLDVTFNLDRYTNSDDVSITITVFSEPGTVNATLYYRTQTTPLTTIHADPLNTTIGVMPTPDLLLQLFNDTDPLSIGQNTTFRFDPGTFGTGDLVDISFSIEAGNKSIIHPAGDPLRIEIKTLVDTETGTDPVYFLPLILAIIIGGLATYYRLPHIFMEIPRVDFIEEKPHVRGRFTSVKDLLTFLDDRSMSFQLTRVLYFSGITGLLIIALDMIIEPTRFHAVSINTALLLLLVSIIVPSMYLYTKAFRSKEKSPFHTRIKDACVASGAVVVLMVNFGTQLWVLIVLFVFLFLVPLYLYGNTLGSYWGFLVHNSLKGVRDGVDLIEGRRITPARRFLSFLLLLEFIFLPIFSLNAISGFFLGNLSDGGPLGAFLLRGFEPYRDSVYIDLFVNFIGFFIVLNLVFIGFEVVKRMMSLQFYDVKGVEGPYHYTVPMSDNVEGEREAVYTLFFSFFGYSITLIFLGIFENLSRFLPELPGINDAMYQEFVGFITFISYGLFFLFWVVSLGQARRLFRDGVDVVLAGDSDATVSYEGGDDEPAEAKDDEGSKGEGPAAEE